MPSNEIKSGAEKADLLHRAHTSFFERAEIYVRPVHVRDLEVFKAHIQYGLVGIRSGFILNGGSLIAMPAFSGILSVGLWENGPIVPGSMLLFFLLGLIFTAAATQYGYHGYRRAHYSMVLQVDRIQRQINYDYEAAIGASPAMDRAVFEVPGERENEHQTRADRYLTLSESLTIISLIMFIAGIIIAVYLFSLGQYES